MFGEQGGRTRMTLTKLLSDAAEDLGRVVEARVNVSQSARLNIIFVRDEMRLINGVPQAEDFYLKKLEDFVTTLEKADVNVILGDEYFDPLHSQYSSDAERLNGSKTARFVSQQLTPTYLMIRHHLFTPNGQNVKLNKHGDHYVGEGNLGFRVCNVLSEVPLGEPDFYFVPAMNISDQVLRPNKGQVIYINDGSKGLRRITDKKDTGWFKEDDLGLRMSNSNQVRHYMLRI